MLVIPLVSVCKYVNAAIDEEGRRRRRELNLRKLDSPDGRTSSIINLTLATYLS
jgi:hypothetical protein